MQTIGKMENGRILTALTAAEYKVLMVIETELTALDPVTTHSAPPATATGAGAEISNKEIRSYNSLVRARREAQKKQLIEQMVQTIAAPKSKTNRHKQCVICGASFTDTTQTNTRKVCIKETCKNEMHRQRRKKYLAPKSKSSPASPVAPSISASGLNPSDPFLTDEQRKEMMARREKLIAASAQKHAEY